MRNKKMHLVICIYNNCIINFVELKLSWFKEFAGDNPLMVIMCGAGIVIFLAGAAFFVVKKQILR